MNTLSEKSAEKSSIHSPSNKSTPSNPKRNDMEGSHNRSVLNGHWGGSTWNELAINHSPENVLTSSRLDEAINSSSEVLDEKTESFFSSCFEHDFSQVKIHTNDVAEISAQQLHAKAYTVNDHIVFSKNHYSPNTQEGKKLLAHELSHVVQNNRSATRSSSEVDLQPFSGASEREADQAIHQTTNGLTVPPITQSNRGISLTPTSTAIEPLISYSATDWAVTDEEEASVISLLRSDTNLSGTINNLEASGMLDDLINRVTENRRELLLLIGDGLSRGADHSLVMAYVRDLGTDAEIQFNMGWYGITSGAPTFDPSPLTTSLVGSDPTQPFTGVGATGVNPTTLSVGPIDSAFLLARDAQTVADYSNPIPGSLPDYLSTLSQTERRQQAELLLRRDISTVEPDAYAGDLPSRLQIIGAAGREHDLAPEHIAGFILAEQRDQSRNEDAKDYDGATSVMSPNLSIGLGQVVISTARDNDLFADLMSSRQRNDLGHDDIARLLASDEYNIFATARYMRLTADSGSTISISTLPNTQAAFPNIDMSAYAGHSSTWPDDNIRALASEYTSRPWDDNLSPGWPDFVFSAVQDVIATGLV